MLEHLIAYELQRRLGGSLPRAALYYFRTKHGVEVDYVLEVDRELWAIEVKASRRVGRSALKGLASFSERTRRLKRKLVVFLGPRKQRINGVDIIPLHRFLEKLPE